MNYTRTKHTDVEIRSLAKQVFDDNLKQVFEKAQEQLNEFFNQVQVEFNKITDDINDIKRFLMPLVDQMSYCEMTITTDREDFKKDIAKIEKDLSIGWTGSATVGFQKINSAFGETNCL